MVVSAKPLVTAMSTLVTVHVSSFEDRIPCGEVYNGYYDKSIPFRNDRELLGVLEELFDTLSFPCRFDNYRCFYDKKRPSPVKKGKRCGNMSEKKQSDLHHPCPVPPQCHLAGDHTMGRIPETTVVPQYIGDAPPHRRGARGRLRAHDSVGMTADAVIEYPDLQHKKGRL